MKTQIILKAQMLLVLTMIFSSCATQTEGQNRTIVNATTSEISDNLDLRVVASIFGDSNTLQDFERRLNDPQLQISNLDLNNDNQVDYLRVIESVENRTHVVIIQSVLARDLYQDVATIEVERDIYNQVNIQVVGNTFMYGQNYIYEPIYYRTPLIYNSFWLSNYTPYYSSWCWNDYPSYYYAWNPFPVFRYRNNVNHCLNTFYGQNNYNYVNHRRSNIAVNIYNSRRSNGYERQNPDFSFERRNSNVANRHELDQRRSTRNNGSRNEVGYSQNRNQSPRASSQQRSEPQSEYSQNRNVNSRIASQPRSQSQSEYSQNRNETQRAYAPQRTEPQRESIQNRNELPRTSSPQRNGSQQGNSQNRNETPRAYAQQRSESQRESVQSRNDSPRASSPQRTEAQRESIQSRNDSPRTSSPQRTESQRESIQSRSETQRTPSEQRTESSRNNSSSRNLNTADNNNASRNSSRRN